MQQYDLAHDSEFSGPNKDVPVIAENVEYESLEAALADNPGWHEASDEEIAAYMEYWNEVHDSATPARQAAEILEHFQRRK